MGVRATGQQYPNFRITRWQIEPFGDRQGCDSDASSKLIFAYQFLGPAVTALIALLLDEVLGA